MPTILRVDGADYPFPDLDSLTFREADLVKRLTGLTMGDMDDAFKRRDVAAVLALAVVSMSRQGAIVDEDAMLDMPIAKIEAVTVPDEAEDGPVDPTLPNGGKSGGEPPDANGNAVSTPTSVSSV